MWPLLYPSLSTFQVTHACGHMHTYATHSQWIFEHLLIQTPNLFYAVTSYRKKKWSVLKQSLSVETETLWPRRPEESVGLSQRISGEGMPDDLPFCSQELETELQKLTWPLRTVPYNHSLLASLPAPSLYLVPQPKSIQGYNPIHLLRGNSAFPKCRSQWDSFPKQKVHRIPWHL